MNRLPVMRLTSSKCAKYERGSDQCLFVYAKSHVVWESHSFYKFAISRSWLSLFFLSFLYILKHSWAFSKQFFFSDQDYTARVIFAIFISPNIQTRKQRGRKKTHMSDRIENEMDLCPRMRIVQKFAFCTVQRTWYDYHRMCVCSF